MESTSNNSEAQFVNAESQKVLAELEKATAAMQSYMQEAEAARATLTQAVEASQANLNETRNAATAALAAKTQIIDEQAVVATKSVHIQSAQEHADKVRAELDRLLTSTMQVVTEAEGHRSRAQSSNDTAAELLAEIRSGRVAAEADVAATVAARDAAKLAA